MESRSERTQRAARQRQQWLDALDDVKQTREAFQRKDALVDAYEGTIDDGRNICVVHSHPLEQVWNETETFDNRAFPLWEHHFILQLSCYFCGRPVRSFSTYQFTIAEKKEDIWGDGLACARERFLCESCRAYNALATDHWHAFDILWLALPSTQKGEFPMPVVIEQTCQHCGKRKLRHGNFPSMVVERALDGTLKRTWGRFCYDCVRNPTIKLPTVPEEIADDLPPLLNPEPDI